MTGFAGNNCKACYHSILHKSGKNQWKLE